MDRRSWLWRRKSSEKSPGETESSGSISSPSERFSDDQAYSNHSTQSPEITSKATPSDNENDTVKTLKEKLSAALLNISAKEELVKQHAKVAEEAVSGWEKAETEVLALKQQLEAVAQKKSALEDRVGHLDGALKECLRQLRQAREEQDQKIRETVVQKTVEWEATKSELKNQLVELQIQLQFANGEVVPSSDPDLRTKLEATENENSALRLELLSRAKELEVTTVERDLSTQAAETASKQHLDSIKKVAKLEAECRRLKAATRKAIPANDQRSVTASSVYVESFTDSQSDSGDRLLVVETDTRKISGLEPNECVHNHSDSWASALITELEQFKSEKDVGKDLRVPSIEINLMDDFLEMEQLAALPETKIGNFLDSTALSDQPPGGEIPLKAELEAVISRTVELEEKLEKMELEKEEMEITLTEFQDQLKQSKGSLDAAELKVVELQTQLTIANEARRITEAELNATDEKLKTSRYESKKTEVKLVELQTQLEKANEARRAAEVEFEAVSLKLKTSGDHLREVEVKLGELHTQFTMANEARREAEMDLEVTNVKKEAAESRLIVVESELKALLTSVGSLEEELQKERAFSGETVSKCQKLEDDILSMKCRNELHKAVMSNGELKIKQDKELAVAASKFAGCQKTIASLGRQLKSLATLEDFLLDSEKLLGFPIDGPHNPQNCVESWKLHSADTCLLKEDSETNTIVDDYSGHLKSRRDGEVFQSGRDAIITSEKCTNGFGKLFPQSKSRS